MRDVIHAFNQKGLAALDPQRAGGRPRPINDDDVDIIVTAATTRLEKLRMPFTHWRPPTWLPAPSGPVKIGRERPRQILHSRGISFQRPQTWKESADPDKDAKLDRIDHVAAHFPVGASRPAKSGPVDPALPWHLLGEDERAQPPAGDLPPHHGIRHFHGCYSLGDDQLWCVIRRRKGEGSHPGHLALGSALPTSGDVPPGLQPRLHPGRARPQQPE